MVSFKEMETSKKFSKCERKLRNAIKKMFKKKNFKRVVDLQIILKLNTLEYRNFL